MEEEARGDGLPDLVEVAAGRHQVQLVAVHDCQQLLPHILRSPKTPCLQATRWVGLQLECYVSIRVSACPAAHTPATAALQ